MNKLKIQIVSKLAENTSKGAIDIIGEIHKEEVERLIPVFIYLALICITGLIGNGLVCYVYRSKCTLSSSRWFIFFLAVVDLIMCALCIPLEINNLALQYNVNHRVICKITVFAHLWSLLSLGFTLLTVSIDRYRKVCKPFGWQINYYKSRLLSAGAVVLGLIVSIPVWTVYDISSFEIYPFNVTVHECSLRKSVDTSKFAFGYVVFGMVGVLGSLAIICVLYFFIGLNIKQRIGTLKRNTLPEQNIVKSSKQKADVHEPAIDVSNNSDTASNEDENLANLSEGDSANFEMPVVPIRSRRTEKTKSRRMRLARARTSTLSMFLISIAFVLSYLPFMSLLLANTLDSGFEESMENEGRVVYKLFFRSYFLNCAINPLLYGISDTKFRESVKEVFNSISHRLQNM